jgi:hypothetical protein
MTAEEFKSNWINERDVLSPISIERLIGLNLKQETIEFLSTAGLPDYVAPYLSFVKDTSDLYDGINKLNRQYELIGEEFDRYVVIGSDGSGNPIALNTALADRLEWLDHEDYFSARYINESINQFGEILLAYRDFVNQIIKENGEEAYVDSNFTDEQFKLLKDKIELIDSKAISEDGFWKEELEMLIANRNDFLSRK